MTNRPTWHHEYKGFKYKMICQRTEEKLGFRAIPLKDQAKEANWKSYREDAALDYVNSIIKILKKGLKKYGDITINEMYNLEMKRLKGKKK